MPKCLAEVVSPKYKVSNINTAPANLTAPALEGELRFTLDGIYVAVANNKWRKTALLESDILTPDRNKLINGDFIVNQEGHNTSLAVAGYKLDRWLLRVDPNGGTAAAGTVTRTAFVLGQTEVPGEPEFYLRINNTSSGTNLGVSSMAIIQQNIEGVRTFAGQTVVFSVWLKSSLSGRKVVTEVSQSFGTGGTPSAAVIFGNSVFTLTTTWQRFMVIVNVPSLIGKTIGTANNDYLSVNLWLQGGTNFNSRTLQTAGLAWETTGTIDIANAQIETGGLPTPFEYRRKDAELIRCQSHYRIIVANAQFPAAAANALSLTNLHYSDMRGIPTAAIITAGTKVNGTATYPQILGITNNSAYFQIQATAAGNCSALNYKIALNAQVI